MALRLLLQQSVDGVTSQNPNRKCYPLPVAIRTSKMVYHRQVIEQTRKRPEVLACDKQHPKHSRYAPEDSNCIAAPHGQHRSPQCQRQRQHSKVDLRLIMVPGRSPVLKSVWRAASALKIWNNHCQQRGRMDRVEREHLIWPVLAD